MKKGDAIGSYILTTEPHEGGGHSEWAFAEKDGEEFFIKRFLSPTYPIPGGPGSEKTRSIKRARCEEFESHHRLVMSKLRPLSGDSGNLITTKDFFRQRAHYYKVTSKVDVSDIGPEQVAAMSRDNRIRIMLTAAKSLETLHRAGLVHGDVKPENLLIKATDSGHFAVKVIDFDNCFLEHRPPVPDQLVGDPAYYSPELLLYNIGEPVGGQLDGKSDVFALGLVFWRYLAGERPVLPIGVTYAAEAVQSGVKLTFTRYVGDRALADLVHSMLARHPDDRPSMSEVHGALKTARKSEPLGRVDSSGLKLSISRLLASMRDPDSTRHPSGRDEEEVAFEIPPVTPGRLYGTLLSRTPASESGGSGSDASGSKLRGRLLKKEE
jgi:serine/threonine protein kinase